MSLKCKFCGEETPESASREFCKSCKEEFDTLGVDTKDLGKRSVEEIRSELEKHLGGKQTEKVIEAEVYGGGGK